MGLKPILSKHLKMIQMEQLITRWSPALLRMELDRWLWKEQQHIQIKRLWEYLSSYCYLPRLKNVDVLLDTIKMDYVQMNTLHMLKVLLTRALSVS